MNKTFSLFCFCLLLLGSTCSFAQKIPIEDGLNRVRITLPEETIVTEVIPVSHDPSLETDRNYSWYSGGRIHSTQGGYSGKLLNGKYTSYYTNRNLKEQGEFKSGLKTGSWRSWNENGNLTQLVTWNKGIRSGEFRQYDEQGNLMQSGSYRKDLLDGKVLVHHGKDSMETIRYKDGAMVTIRADGEKRKFWSRFWPFNKSSAAKEKKLKAPKSPKVKKHRKPAEPEAGTATPGTAQ